MRYRVSRYYGEDFIFEDAMTAMAFAETMFKHQMLHEEEDGAIRIIIDEPKNTAEKRED